MKIPALFLADFGPKITAVIYGAVVEKVVITKITFLCKYVAGSVQKGITKYKRHYAGYYA